MLKSREPPFNADDELPYDTASLPEYNGEAHPSQPEPAGTHAGDAAKALALPRRIQRQRKPLNYLKDYDTT